jgi:hypothetical protein
MWYTILITLVVDFGGLLIVYLLLQQRVRRATSSESRISEIREEVSRLLVELNQATDRNIALMEDKIAVLNEAISTADKKIGLLRRETEKHDVGSQIYTRLAEGRPRRAALTAPAQAEAGRIERPVTESAESAEYRGAEVRQSAPAAPPLAVELSERAGIRGGQPADYRGAESADDGFAESPPSAGKHRAGAPDVRQRVMMLSRAGFSPSLIAGRVGVPLGEVELIISLEQRKGQA